MRRARRQLAERYQFFGLHHLRLQSLQVFDGLLRSRQQSRAVRVRQMSTQEYQESDGHRGNQGDHQTKIADFRSIVLEAQRENREYGQRYDRSHREPGGPHAFPWLFFAVSTTVLETVQFGALQVGNYAG